MKFSSFFFAAVMITTSSAGVLAADASAPLLPLGAAPSPTPDAVQAAPAHRSKAMMVSGIVVTSLGAAMLASGVAISMAGAGSADSGGSNLVVYLALPMIAGSVGLAGVGIPLWVVGGRSPVGPTCALSVGAGSAMLRGSF